MDDLIKVVQLPVIEEQLRTLKDRWEQHAADAESMVCTEETIQAVKALRAEMRKEFDEVEALRKAVKKAVMGPYEQFLAVYEECVSDPFCKADRDYALKISEVETEQKRRCEEGLRDYFAELTAVHHLEWLEYERANIKVDMASAKAKTPKKLREQILKFVVGVSQDIESISGLENSDEVLAEYKQTLNAAGAIRTVLERHKRIDDERAAQAAKQAEREQEAQMIRRVEALAPPVVVEQPKVYECTFTVHTTMDKLKKLKEFLNMEGIKYE